MVSRLGKMFNSFLLTSITPLSSKLHSAAFQKALCYPKVLKIPTAISETKTKCILISLGMWSMHAVACHVPKTKLRWLCREMLAQASQHTFGLKSRVRNASVHAQAGVSRFSHQLLKQQLMMFGKVALAPPGSPLSLNWFIDDSFTPQICRFVLKVGRPRQNLTNELLK